jgi:hypothetical protein
LPEQANTILEGRLGIEIELLQVQLRTNPDNPYIWERIVEKEYLFSKDIRDHSIAAFKELYYSIGISFVAIRKIPTQAGGFYWKVYTTNYTGCIKLTVLNIELPRSKL